MTLYITGFSLAGKTTTGRLLAEKYGLSFIDLDGAVEALAGMPISEIFRTGGEDAFRALESKVLIFAQADIVATGGGTMTVPANITFMKQNGKIVLLAVSPAEVWRRLQASFIRPLLRDGGIEGIRKLMFTRAAAYCHSDLALDVTELTPETAAEKLHKFLLT